VVSFRTLVLGHPNCLLFGSDCRKEFEGLDMKTLYRVVGTALAAWLLIALAPGAAVAGEGNLSYLGGPVLHSSAPYLVFWTPSGERIPARSRSLMRRYFTDVAADSGKASNVFGVLRQYYDRTGFADYQQKFDPARQVIVDRQPYPAQDPAVCPHVSSAYPTCIGDPQIQSELRRLIAADGLPTAGSVAAAFPGGAPNGVGPLTGAIGGGLSARAPIYFVILPADVNVCYLSGTQCTNHGCADTTSLRPPTAARLSSTR
jgi:hypothetical protein